MVDDETWPDAWLRLAEERVLVNNNDIEIWSIRRYHDGLSRGAQIFFTLRSILLYFSLSTMSKREKKYGTTNTARTQQGFVAVTQNVLREYVESFSTMCEGRNAFRPEAESCGLTQSGRLI